MVRILISACLLGQPVRYDGQGLKDLPPLPLSWFAHARLIPFCPEAAGGLSVPRSPAEIQGGDGLDVIDADVRSSIDRALTRRRHLLPVPGRPWLPCDHTT